MVIEMRVVGKGEGWAEVGWSEVGGRGDSGSWLLVVGNRKTLFLPFSACVLWVLASPPLSLSHPICFLGVLCDLGDRFPIVLTTGKRRMRPEPSGQAWCGHFYSAELISDF